MAAKSPSKKEINPVTALSRRTNAAQRQKMRKNEAALEKAPQTIGRQFKKALAFTIGTYT
jgi:hypothetical protein